MSKPDIQMMLMRIRSKINAENLTDVARELGVSRYFVDRIINADDPSALRINSEKKELVERKYAEMFGRFEDDSANDMTRLPSNVSFFRLIKLLNSKNISTRKIAMDINLSASTIYNYSMREKNPPYSKGAKLINYAAKHLDTNELKSAGVICD